MKFTATVENGFAKFEVYDCNFKKAKTIATHLRNYVFKKSGIDMKDHVDVGSTPYLESIRKYNEHGEIAMRERWSCDAEGKDCPEYLAFVFEVDDDCDGGYNYAYFGINEKTGWKVKEDFIAELPKELVEELAE